LDRNTENCSKSSNGDQWILRLADHLKFVGYFAPLAAEEFFWGSLSGSWHPMLVGWDWSWSDRGSCVDHALAVGIGGGRRCG